MNNKKNLQILFFAVLGIGVALIPFKDTRPYGFVLVCLLQPIIGLHYITQIKKSETTEGVELVFRYPLLIALQFTFIILLVKLFFMAMHWPFVGPVNAIVYVVSTITLLIAIVFIIKNRKTIQSIFIIEFILLLTPVFLLMCFVMPANYSGSEYSDLLKKQYADLNQIENTLYQNVKKDTLIDLATIDIIIHIKEKTIVQYGGWNEDGTLEGGRKHLDQQYAEKDLEKLHNDRLVNSVMRDNPSTVIEYLNALTKLQIDILLEKKK